MNEFYLKDETYKIIGLCMEVHKYLGKGHNEKVYGDALEIEFKLNNVPYTREQKYNIEYKGIKLSSYYYSDFTVYDEIILELKAIQELTSSETKQVLNYLAASKNKIGILANFGEDSLKYKRLIL
jgi:GxxExxY protein